MFKYVMEYLNDTGILLKKSKIYVKNIKAVALDMDGTLLTTSKELSPATRECIKELDNRGILPVLVTGRSYESLKPFKDELGITTPVICYNGAQIIDGRSGKILKNSTLSEASTSKIINIAKAEDVFVLGYREGELLFEEERAEGLFYEDHVRLKGRIMPFNKLDPFKFTKMMYISNHSRLERIKDRVTLETGHDTSIMFSNVDFLEFMYRGVSKGASLLSVLTDLGISPEETIAFGDGENDISMLETAGVGVAMGNAPSNVKASSDFITLSNDEEGIVNFLKEIDLF